MGKTNLDDALKGFVLANKRGYEWRIVDDNGEISHYFFDPTNHCYDNDLKESVIGNDNAVSFSEFILYLIEHPIKLTKGFFASYSIRKRYKDKHD